MFNNLRPTYGTSYWPNFCQMMRLALDKFFLRKVRKDCFLKKLKM